MADWGYDAQNGPDTWPSKYPHAGGQSQSPIDIVTSVVQSRSFDEPLNWSYEPDKCRSLTNTGCGWRVDVQPNNSELSGGPLSHAYQLVQFHCHWGATSSCGSEHTVDGKPYSGELHFVHWNKEMFPTCADAVPSPKGLTVIAVFLEVGDKNSEIEKICKMIPSIPLRDQRIDLPSDMDPVAMFPSDRSFWTYNGSLTTPPCYESVTPWIVFKNPITVSEEQLNCFRQMKKPCVCEDSEDPGCVEFNYRPPQSLNNREIYECAC